MEHSGKPALVSVIVPGRDAADVIEYQLDALASQTYSGDWELIFVDSGSRDRTVQVVDNHNVMKRVQGRVVAASNTTNAASARNAGIKSAAGDFLAFCDADDVVSANWIRELVRAGQDADLVGGWLNTEPLNSSKVRSWRVSYPRDHLPSKAGFLEYSQTANLGVWRYVFEEIGLFDHELVAGEDVDFSWRAQLSGYSLSFTPNAEVAYRHREKLIGLASQSFRYGRADVILERRYRQFLEQHRQTAELLRGLLWLVIRLPYLVSSSRRRGTWIRIGAHTLGIAVGMLTPARIAPDAATTYPSESVRSSSGELSTRQQSTEHRQD